MSQFNCQEKPHPEKIMHKWLEHYKNKQNDKVSTSDTKEFNCIFERVVFSSSKKAENETHLCTT